MPVRNKSVLEKLEDMLGNGELVVFPRHEAEQLRELVPISDELRTLATLTKDDVDDLRDMLQYYRGLAMLGKMLKFTRAFVVFVGGAFLVWKGKETIAEYIKSLAGGH